MEEYAHISLETYKNLLDKEAQLEKILDFFKIYNEYYDKEGNQIHGFFINDYDTKKVKLCIDIPLMKRYYNTDFDIIKLLND